MQFIYDTNIAHHNVKIYANDGSTVINSTDKCLDIIRS